MKLNWHILLVGLFISAGLLPLQAVQVPDKPDFYAEDILNQSSIYVYQGRSAGTCQAVKITPTWYLTAAHCVYPSCKKECTVDVYLLQGGLQAVARIKHTTRNPRVFVPGNYLPNSDKNVRNDMALIHFIPQEEDFFFFEEKTNKALDYTTFQNLLNKTAYLEQAAQWRALSQARPALLTTTNVLNRQITVPIAVPDLRSGELTFRQSSSGDYYYLTELWHYFGMNFGVGKGMSGSGVIVPGGKLLGIVSTNMNRSGMLVAYNDKDEPVFSVPYSSEYFMFAPFSEANRSFIDSIVLKYRDTSSVKPYFVTLTDLYAVPTDLTLEKLITQNERELVQVPEEKEDRGD